MDNKGFIKTLEAVISIVLLLGFILFMLSMTKQNEVSAKPFVVQNSQTYILDQVLYNANLRDCVSKAGSGGTCANILSIPDPNCAELFTGTNGIITKNTPPGYETECEICPNAASCIQAGGILKDLYTDARFIGKSGSDDLKVIRIYMYET
jgi:hypothetical protein